MAAKHVQSATLTLRPHKQDLDSVHRLVADVLGRAGCPRCGRIAYLKIDFLGDPPPELDKEGVISYQSM